MTINGVPDGKNTVNKRRGKAMWSTQKEPPVIHFLFILTAL